MTGIPPTAESYDPEAVRAKYLAERDKRLVPGRADIRDLRTDEHFRPLPDDPFTPVVERDPVADDVDVVIVGGGIAGVLAGAQLRKAGVERIRIVDQAGGIGGTWYWNRYPGVMCDVESYIYLPMLEELDYIPTRRYAFGEEIRRHLEAIADRFDLVRRRPVPHRGHPRRVARGRGPVADPHRPRRRGQLPLVRAGRRDPQPHEAARHPGHGGLRRALVPHGPVGLRVHRRRSARAPHRPGGQGRRPHRHRGQRHPVRAAAGRVGEAPLRVPAHAVGHRRAGQPAHRSRLRRRARAGLAAGPDGQLPGDHAGPARRGRPGRRRVDAPLRRRPAPAAGRGHDHGRVPAQRRGARLPDHGGAPAPGRRAGGRPGHGRDPQAVLPLPLQAALLPRRVPAGLQQPQRHADRLPGRDRADHRAGSGRRRAAVRGRLHHLRHRLRGRAHPAVPSRRPRHRRSRRRHPGREVGRRCRQPVRDDEPWLPEHVRHAGTRAAGGGDRQLHAAGRARGRVHRRRRRAARAAGTWRCST